MQFLKRIIDQGLNLQYQAMRQFYNFIKNERLIEVKDNIIKQNSMKKMMSSKMRLMVSAFNKSKDFTHKQKFKETN